MTTKQQLIASESEIRDQLNSLAILNQEANGSITDGVVDIDRYLASTPKILWILKEPWDEFIGGEPSGGGWSISESLAKAGSIGNKGTWARVAYVCYSVFHNFPDYSSIPYVTEDPEIQDSVKHVAYINVKKFPGKTTSNSLEILGYYNKYRDLLKKQIFAINADVIIAGNVLPLFYEDFGLTPSDFQTAGTVDFCRSNGRLYANAYHPGYWYCGEATYVNDLVAVIKSHILTLKTLVVN